MSVHVLYFSWVRERTGLAGEEVELPAPASVASVAALLARRSDGHAAAFADPSRLRAAINQQFAPFTETVRDGDELAFFPPVTGG